MLELHGSGAFITITNDNWREDPVQEALILATGIPPSNDLESAIDATLNPGAYTALIKAGLAPTNNLESGIATTYTALLAGRNSGTGIGLVEVYGPRDTVARWLLSDRCFRDVSSRVARRRLHSLTLA